MEDRSSRRMRTLVTRMARSANTGDPNGPFEACPLISSNAR
jgi:hypothetical protein